MTPSVNDVTQSLLSGEASAWVVRRADAILVLVLLVLVVEREVLRAYLGDGAEDRLRPFLVAVRGLLPAFAVVAVARMAGLR